MKQNTSDFLARHSLCPEAIKPEECAEKMVEHMRSGLEGKVIDVPMIPTYLKGTGSVPLGKKAVVIDAGGTNYRAGLASFDETGCHVTNLAVSRMPGTGSPASWEEFISFAAGSIEPLLAEADVIGFCFSYDAEITPEMDGRVHRIDKEVNITGCEGKLIGEDLLKELERRGVSGKKVIILNDTVAALLGGSAGLAHESYSDFIGMICGTGINTCAGVAIKDIVKLGYTEGEGSMLINLESGCYSAMPSGDIDAAVDRNSLVPGEKLMEKMCSGAYVGDICKAALLQAAEEGIISKETGNAVNSIEKLNGAVVDAWARGEDRWNTFQDSEEAEFAADVCRAVFERSAKCMSTNILSIMLLNGTGTDSEKPACVCAEGSLISRSAYFLPALQKALEAIAADTGRHAVIKLGHDTTLPGSAAAALLNG